MRRLLYSCILGILISSLTFSPVFAISQRHGTVEDLAIQQTDGGAAESVTEGGHTGTRIHGGAFPWDNSYTRTIRPGDIITKGPWVDVRAFGAKCDGVTDDAAAIQAVLDSLPNGGVIIIPGTCAVGTTLTYQGLDQALLNIIGEGPRPTLLWIGQDNGIIFNDNAATSSKAWVNIDGIIFRSANDNAVANAINFAYVGMSTIQRCRFYNVRDAIRFNFVLLSNVTKNFFSKVLQDGVYVDVSTAQSNGNVISNNEFYWCGRYSINFTCSGSCAAGNGNIIENNDFEGTVAGTIHTIHLDGFARGVITKNRFEDGVPSGGAGLRSIYANNVVDTEITFNVFGEAGGPQEYFIELVGNVSAIRMIGNVYVNVKTACVNLTNNAAMGMYSIAESCTGTKFAGVGGFLIKQIASTDGTLVGSNVFNAKLSGASGNNTGETMVELNGVQFAALNSAPTTGTWNIGNIVWNRAWNGNIPTDITDNPIFWYCSASGTPGTWKPVYPIFQATVASKTAFGKPGMISMGANYLYWNSPVGDNTWHRVAYDNTW